MQLLSVYTSLYIHVPFTFKLDNLARTLVALEISEASPALPNSVDTCHKYICVFERLRKYCDGNRLK